MLNLDNSKNRFFIALLISIIVFVLIYRYNIINNIYKQAKYPTETQGYVQLFLVIIAYIISLYVFKKFLHMCYKYNVHNIIS